MSHSAHKTEEEVREHFVDEKTLEKQAKELAQLIRNAEHMVSFTGAGISTSAGIPDFRGPEGVWTMRAQGKHATVKTSTIRAFPTPTHMSLVALAESGHLKFLISQNTDGLHRRSAFPVDKLAELHGNNNLEKCQSCGKEYLRDFGCRARGIGVYEHKTGRKCACGGALEDSIINFGESLPKKALHSGFAHSEKADLMLVLGSSLRVTPAADMPRRTAEKGRHLVICNLQETPMDEDSRIRIYARTDELMIRVLKHLNIPLPSWKLQRYASVQLTEDKDHSKLLTLEGVEPDGTPATIFSRVKMSVNETKDQEDLRHEPFRIKVQRAEKISDLTLNLNLHFMGHYNEPPLDFEASFSPEDGDRKKLFRLEFDPEIGCWSVDAV